MLARPAARFAQEHGFGAVLLAVPVRWEAYSSLVSAMFPAVAALILVAAALYPRPDMWPVLVMAGLFALGTLVGPLVFRGRGLVVTEGGILVGNFGPGKDIAAARWDQIELDSLRAYTNVKRAFLIRSYRGQRAPQIGTSAESHGVAFVGPALAAARPQGMTWWQRMGARAALGAQELDRLDGADPVQVWAAAMRREDLAPLAHAVRTALDAAGSPYGEVVASQLTTPTDLPRDVQGAVGAVFASAAQDGLLGGRPLTDERVQIFMMNQAIAMRPDKARN